MSAVDFDEWGAPDLTLTWKGHEYKVPAPCTIDARKLLAAAALGEVRNGAVVTQPTDDVLAVMQAISPDDHFALSQPVYDQMVADKVPQTTIDRMAYYAVFYWARGREYADIMAAFMWGGEIALEAAAEAAADLPKAPRSSRRQSGPSTA